MGTMTDECNEHIHCSKCEIPCKLYCDYQDMIVGLIQEGWLLVFSDKEEDGDMMECYCPNCERD